MWFCSCWFKVWKGDVTHFPGFIHCHFKKVIEIYSSQLSTDALTCRKDFVFLGCSFFGACWRLWKLFTKSTRLMNLYNKAAFTAPETLRYWRLTILPSKKKNERAEGRVECKSASANWATAHNRPNKAKWKTLLCQSRKVSGGLGMFEGQGWKKSKGHHIYAVKRALFTTFCHPWGHICTLSPTSAYQRWLNNHKNVTAGVSNWVAKPINRVRSVFMAPPSTNCPLTVNTAGPRQNQKPPPRRWSPVWQQGILPRWFFLPGLAPCSSGQSQFSSSLKKEHYSLDT